MGDGGFGSSFLCFLPFLCLSWICLVWSFCLLRLVARAEHLSFFGRIFVVWMGGFWVSWSGWMALRLLRALVVWFLRLFWGVWRFWWFGMLACRGRTFWFRCDVGCVWSWRAGCCVDSLLSSARFCVAGLAFVLAGLHGSLLPFEWSPGMSFFCV